MMAVPAGFGVIAGMECMDGSATYLQHKHAHKVKCTRKILCGVTYWESIGKAWGGVGWSDECIMMPLSMECTSAKDLLT